MTDPFTFDAFSGLAPGDRPAPGTPVIGRGYEPIGEDIFAADIGGVAVPVHSWVPFASTNLDSAYWAPTPDITSMVGSLFVCFLSWSVYRYDAVGYQTWAELISSPSHGMYFSNQIKPYRTGILIEPATRKVTEELRLLHSGRVHVS